MRYFLCNNRGQIRRIEGFTVTQPPPPPINAIHSLGGEVSYVRGRQDAARFTWNASSDSGNMESDSIFTVLGEDMNYYQCAWENMDPLARWYTGRAVYSGSVEDGDKASFRARMDEADKANGWF